MIVEGERRPSMDVLAGASTTRIETDARLVEGASIDDLLSEVPGVQIRRFGGAGERFEISIRGSRPEQVPVFLDGIRLDTALTGRSDLSNLCLDVLEEIQVTRGAGAARAGTGAIGGVVNLISRRPAEKPETRLRVAGGGFETFEGSIRHARRMGPWDLSAGYCGFRTEGDFKFQQPRVELGDGTKTGSTDVIKRINNEAERHTGIARVGREIGEGRIHVSHFSSFLSRGTPGSSFNQRPFAHERDYSTRSSLAFEYPVAPIPGGRFDLALSHRYERNTFDDPEFGIGTPPIDVRTEVQGVMGRASVSSKGRAFGASNEASLLAEFRHDRREASGDDLRTRNGIALRAELESNWWGDRISLASSLRMERYEDLDVEWIPSVSARFEFIDGIELRAAAARTYRVPSFEELYLPDKGFERGNPDLRPEDSWSVEAGVLLVSPFADSWLDGEIEATWFASEIDDSIAFQLVSSTTVEPRNTGRADVNGYELALRWRPRSWLRVTAARTVTDAEVDRTGSRLVGIAVSQTDGRLEIGPPDFWKLVGEVHYSGRIPVAGGDLAELPSRTTFDASASIDLVRIPGLPLERFARSLWLSARGRNLGNEAIRDTLFFPRPGRYFSFALEGVF